jgi:thymidylate synthase (FAD)
MSFAQESTRYCNYSKGKFGNELTAIEPTWYEGIDSFAKNEFDKHLRDCESMYMWLLQKSLKPQEAAAVLPNCLKADIVVTGFVSDWKHLLDLRYKGTTGAPHPQMKSLMEPLYNEFVERGYVQ